MQSQNENSFIGFLLIIEAMLPLSKTIETYDCIEQEVNIPTMLSLYLVPLIVT